MTLFELGRIELRAGAAAALKANNVTSADLLARYQQGDWGDMDEVDYNENNASIKNEYQLYGLYILADGSKIKIETADDRTATCIFLEGEHDFQEMDAREGYDLWAATYDRWRNPLIELEEAVAEPLIAELPISSVLDMGTGTGRYALKLARRGATVTAVDQSSGMMALAQEAAQAEGLEIDFRLASVTDDLPFAAGQFDFVMCALMLSHIPDLTQVAQKFHDYLQADGHLLITMFHPDTIINHGWRTTFDGPGISYGLPNVSRSRADYLEILTATGFNVLHAIDAPLRDVPAGIIPPAFIEEMGDVNFCLIILAQKGDDS
ncbi:MAG: class I SAM-dependent methyltransferase [Chloroflexota bacterium]